MDYNLFHIYDMDLYFCVDSAPGRKELRPLPAIFQTFANKGKLFSVKFPIDQVDDTKENDVLTQTHGCKIKKTDSSTNFTDFKINGGNIKCNLNHCQILNL